MRLRHGTLSLLGLLSLVALSSVPVHAQITAAPSLMNFQGRLAKPDGTPVADGTYSVRFSLWNALSAGTETWNQTVASVTVKNGTFAVQLSGFSASTFNSNQWLEIKIGTDAPLTPRQPLVSVPYALKANSVPDGSITGASIANGAITSDKLASGTLNNLSWLLGGNSGTNPASQFIGTTDNQPLVFKTNNAERMRLLADGTLGIGILTPVARVDIRGGETPVGAPAFIVGGLSGAQGQRAIAGLYSTFMNVPADTNARRTADLVAGFNGGAWGTEYLAFHVGNNGVANDAAGLTSEKVRILSNGNVGIGTATPGAMLHVKGGLSNVGIFAGDLAPLGVSPFETNISASATHAWFAENSTRVFSVTAGGAGYFGGGVEMAGIKLASGAAAGRVLTSDASGNGTWQVAAGAGWNLTGNAGTNPSTQFLGTTDAQPLVFRTGNTEKLRLLANGNVGIGTATPGVKLDVAGEIRGTVVTITGGSDVAEPYNVANAGEVKPLPGYVVAIDPDKVGQMRVAARAYDKTVAGIISGANGINPGITLRQKGTVADGSLPVASIGRVWCWCDADANGAIEAGDMLTTSDTPGHAMKVSDHSKANGSVIGKAMSSLKSGKGLVLVLVSLK